MEFIFKLCIRIYHSKNQNNRSKSWQNILIGLIGLEILTQTTQFFWFPSIKIHEWENYSKFWHFLSYLSLNALAVELDKVSQYLIIGLSLYLSFFALLSLIIILQGLERPIPNFILSLTRMLTFACCEIFYIPTCIFLLQIIKYSSGNYNVIQEYSVNIDSSGINYGAPGQAASVLFLIYYLLLTSFYEATFYDVRHSKENQIFNFKAHSYCNLLQKSFYFISSYCFVFIQSTDTSYHRSLLVSYSLMNFLVAMSFICYIPYYSFSINYFHIFITIDSGCIALFFLIGLLTNNAVLIFQLVIFSQIPLFLLVHQGLQFRYSLIKKLTLSKSRSFEFFEISIRNHLTDGDLGEDLLKHMNDNRKLDENPLNLILQSYYCLDILDHPTLSLNKITTVSHSGLNIFKTYQIYKCKQEALSVCSKVSESLKILNFFVEFEDAKENDKRLCIVFLQFIKKILEPEPKLAELKKLIVKLVNKIELVTEKYEGLLKKYPKSAEVKEYYGSLLMSILSDVETGTNYVRKSREENEKSAKVVMKNYLVFGHNRGFIVLSGEKNNIGKILYFNSIFLNMLGYTEEVFKTLYMEAILPSHIRKHHNSYLIRFLKNYNRTVAFYSFNLYIINSEGYLKECVSSCEVIGHNSTLNFLTTFDLIESSQREFCLLSPNGYIIEHSEKFSSLLAPNLSRITGRFVQEFLVNFDAELLECGNTVKFQLVGKSGLFSSDFVNVLKKINNVGSTSFLACYMSHNETYLSPCDIRFNEDFEEKPSLKYNKISSEVVIENEKKIKKVNIFDERGEREEIFDVKPNEDELTQNSVFYITLKELSSVKKSILVLNITKVVLLCTVIVLISSNIIILFYISNEAQHSISLQAFKDLNGLRYTLSQTAFIIRGLDLSSKKQINPVFTLNDSITNIENLIKYRDKFANGYSAWSYCRASDILNTDNINYLEFNSEVDSKISNLHQFISQIIMHAEFITNQINCTQNNYGQSLMFILANVLGPTFDQISKAHQGLEVCEKDRISELTVAKSFLLVGGITVTAICFVVVAAFFISIDKFLNSLWESLLRKTKGGNHDIKRALIERLVKKHQCPEYYEYNDS